MGQGRPAPGALGACGKSQRSVVTGGLAGSCKGLQGRPPGRRDSGAESVGRNPCLLSLQQKAPGRGARGGHCCPHVLWWTERSLPQRSQGDRRAGAPVCSGKREKTRRAGRGRPQQGPTSLLEKLVFIRAGGETTSWQPGE